MSRPSRRKGNSGRQRYDNMDEEPAPKRRAPSSNYVLSAGTGAGTVSRIREPHPHDILCGRGGSINNHEGNRKFRDWIHERKNDYNLAVNKSEKTRVSREIVNLVEAQDPPGRFLTRDPSAPTMGPTWWIMIDDAKAMAKTSQALREGAPAIRAAHKEELEGRKQGGTRRGTKRNASVLEEEQEDEPEPKHEPVAWPEPSSAPHHEEPSEEQSMPPPPVVAMSNEMAIEALRTAAEAAKHGFGAPLNDERSAELIARAMVHHDDHYPSKKTKFSDEAVTPPLMPVSGEEPHPKLNLSSIEHADTMKRAHSLALSDINDGDLEFVNPFEDESEHPGQLLNRSPGSNHSVGHMSFSSLPKLSSSDLSRNRSNGNNHGSPFRKNLSSRSMISDLSDLPDPDTPTRNSDFDEGLKSVWGAVHPDITSTGKEEDAHTHLYPFKGGSPLTRRFSPQKKKRKVSSDVKNWRQ